MNIVFYILIAIFLLIFTIISSRVIFSLEFDGNLRLRIKLLFLKFDFYVPILYRPQKTDDDDTEYVFVSKEDTKATKKKGSVKTKEKTPFPGIINSILYFKDALKGLFSQTVHSFRLEKLHFKAIAASDDAAKTAELYGVMCTAASAIHQFATNAKGIKKNAVYIEVKPDFMGESSDFYADVRFSIRVWRILLIIKKVLSISQGYKKLARKVHLEKEAEKAPDKKNNTKKNINKKISKK